MIQGGPRVRALDVTAPFLPIHFVVLGLSFYFASLFSALGVRTRLTHARQLEKSYENAA